MGYTFGSIGDRRIVGLTMHFGLLTSEEVVAVMILSALWRAPRWGQAWLAFLRDLRDYRDGR
jgi:chaperone required for assembly of F1-ATPase